VSFPTKPVLFTPGPVRLPASVAASLSDPPCNYHRQPAFQEMFAETETALKKLIGIADLDGYFATTITSTGTGVNEACLRAMSGLGKGAVVRNGYFGARAADQAAQNGLDHVALEFPEDRSVDVDELASRLDRHGDLKWLFFVSHETRVGLRNPFVDIGRACKQRGMMVAADIISSAYAYPLDIEASGVDLAVASSAKAIMSAAGIGIVFVRKQSVPALRDARRHGSYYFDLVAEYEKQSAEMQTRFAQPVPLHAALHAACAHLTAVGVDKHMARIKRQLDEISAHLRGLGVDALLDPKYQSGIATNFRLPPHIPYGDFARRMSEQGYYVLYGIPGDDTHFQVSTIGDIEDRHVAGFQDAATAVLRP